MHTVNERENSSDGNHKHKTTRIGSDTATGCINKQVRNFCKSTSAAKEGS